MAKTLAQIGRRRTEVKFDHTAAVINDATQGFIRTVRGNLRKIKKEASGKLLASIRPQIKAFGRTWEVTIHAEDYWKWIDQGRQGHGKFPPYTDRQVNVGMFTMMGGFPSIAGWLAHRPEVLQSFMAKHRIGDGKSGRSLLNAKRRAAKSLAFLIARKLSRSKWAPTHFLTGEMEGFRQGLQIDLSRALKKDVQVWIVEIAKNN